MARLEGRTAIVTGGAKGIGVHYSRALTAEGAQVMIADIADGSGLAAEIAAKHGRNSTDSMVFDVSDEAQCKALVDKTIERFGKIDILINNAALYAPLPTLKVTEIDVDLWDKVMGINIRGPFLMVKHTAPHMIARKYGKIVNIGSGTVARGIPDFSHYVTSKGAVDGVHALHLTRARLPWHLRQHAGTGLHAVRHGTDQHRACRSVQSGGGPAPRPQARRIPRGSAGNPGFPVFQRQRLHDRSGAGGRWRGQQHRLISGQIRLRPANREYRLRQPRGYQFA